MSALAILSLLIGALLASGPSSPTVQITPSAKSSAKASRSYQCAYSVATALEYVGIYHKKEPKIGFIQPLGVIVQPSLSAGGLELIIRESVGQVTRYGTPVAAAAVNSILGTATFITSRTRDQGDVEFTTYTFWGMNSDHPQTIMRILVTSPPGAWGSDTSDLLKPRTLSPALEKRVVETLQPIVAYDSVGDCGVGAIDVADDRYNSFLAKKADGGGK